MSYSQPIAARIAGPMMRGLLTQPVTGAVAVVACLLIGAPLWVIAAQGLLVIGMTAFIARELRTYRRIRPEMFFAAMTTGVSILYLVYGALVSPLPPALGTLPTGAAAVSPSPRNARIVRFVCLTLLALGVVFELTGAPLAGAPLVVDRELDGAGFYFGTVVTFIVMATGVAMGGLAARALRLALDETEAVDAVARAERVASVEARTRDVMLLTGHLARELEAPLASVKARAASVQARTEDPTTKQRLGVLAEEVDRVGRRLEHYLRVSRTALDPERIDAAALLRELAISEEGLASERGVELVVAADSVEVTTDREKLLEVLENLVQNAVEASPPGSRVELAARAAGDGVELEVTDAGPGLGAEAIDRIFTPGFTTKARGSGLGLVLSRRIAEQLGGALELENRSPAGCRARLLLPRAGSR